MNVINSFTKEYRFLSNFYITPVTYEGITYPSSENAYQAAKSRDADTRIKMATLSPAQSKKLGQTVTLIPEWELNKVNIMETILKSKFENIQLARWLKDTDDAILIEGNLWHDNFWGACNCPTCADKKKLNTLGQLLMKVRSELT